MSREDDARCVHELHEQADRHSEANAAQTRQDTAAQQLDERHAMSRHVERFEEMSPKGRLRVHVQDDGDVIIAVIADPDEHRLGSSVMMSAEFCTYAGGGRSPHTRNAILALYEAIVLDNIENPQHRE